jgi:O-antigen ligase
VGTVILGLTQSRGGGLGFAAGFAVVVWHVWPYWGRRIVLIGLVVALISIWTPTAAQLRSLFGVDALLHTGPVQVTTSNFATQERLAHWGAALRMWEHSPWFGIGAGNFPERYREYTPVWRFRISRGHAHSAYLQAAAQAGTVGLACYVSLLAAVWRQNRRTIEFVSDVAARSAALGGLAVTVAFAVHGIFDYVHVLSLGLGLSVLWGMAHDDGARRVGGAVDHGGN